jgi:gamma-glutamylcyclotransferase (GGCT)/AIG2-like uncharacterized protein YtfP
VTHRLFSYGTLGQGDVQASLFGRAVPTVQDSLPGHRLDWIVIIDPNVIATSGSDRHPILRPGSPDDSVEGVYLELSDAELERADEYEVDDYVRTAVRLSSGVEAWVYMGSDRT